MVSRRKGLSVTALYFLEMKWREKATQRYFHELIPNQESGLAELEQLNLALGNLQMGQPAQESQTSECQLRYSCRTRQTTTWCWVNELVCSLGRGFQSQVLYFYFPFRIYEETLNCLLYENRNGPDQELMQATSLRVPVASSYTSDDEEGDRHRSAAAAAAHHHQSSASQNERAGLARLRSNKNN